MLASSDSRRRQQRVPVAAATVSSHATTRTTGRFHIDAVVKSSDQQAFDGVIGQPASRSCLRACILKIKIRNFFFVIIGCASPLLIGWVNLSASNIIPNASSSDMDHQLTRTPQPIRATKTKKANRAAPLNSLSKKSSVTRNLSTKRFSSLGARTDSSNSDNDQIMDTTDIDRRTSSRDESNLDASGQMAFRSRRKSQSSLSDSTLAEEPLMDKENQHDNFQDWKTPLESDLEQPLPDSQQQRSIRKWKSSRDTETFGQGPPNSRQFSKQQFQDGQEDVVPYKQMRNNQPSLPRNSASDHPRSDGVEDNESGLNGPLSSPAEEIEEDLPQQPLRTASYRGRNRQRYSPPDLQEDPTEPQRQDQISFQYKSSLNNLPEDGAEYSQEQGQLEQDEDVPNINADPGPYLPQRVGKIHPNNARGIGGEESSSSSSSSSAAAVASVQEEFSTSLPLECSNLEQSQADRITYWKETKDSDYDVVSAYRLAGGRETKYLTFELNATNIQWNSRRRLLETMVALAFATGRTLVLPPKMTLITSMEEMTKMGMSPWLGFQDLITLPSQNFQGISVISMDRFLELEGTTGRLKTTPQQNRQGGTPLSPPNGYAHWDGAANMHDLWRYLQTVSYQPDDWDPETCVLGIPSGVKKSAIQNPEEAVNMFDSASEVISADTGPLRSWMDSIWGKHHGRPPPNRLEYQGRPTRVDAPAVERLREMVAERQRLCHYGQDLQDAKVLHLQGDQLESYPFYSFVFFENWKQDLLVKRLVRDHLRYRDEIVCAAAQVVDHLEAADSANVPAHFHGIHLVLRDLIKGDSHFEEDDLNVAMSLLVDDLKKWIQPGSRLYVATDMDEQRDCFQILRQTYHLVFISYIESLLDGRIKPVFYPMVEQLVLARAHTFVGSYPSTFSAYVNRLRGYYTTVVKRKSRNGDVADLPTVDTTTQDGSLASYYLAPRVVQKQMRIYQALRQPLGDLEYPVAWRDIDRL